MLTISVTVKGYQKPFLEMMIVAVDSFKKHRSRDVACKIENTTIPKCWVSSVAGKTLEIHPRDTKR